MSSKPAPPSEALLRTREDVADFAKSILDPLESHTSPGGARVHLGFTGAHFDETAAQLEGFSRPIWALASLIAGGDAYSGASRWVYGLANGTDPSHPEFWGEQKDKDQRMVECAALGFALAVGREQFWDPLDDNAKRNLETWLGGMNGREMPNTNWLWFRLDLTQLDTFYISSGWSRDGPEGVLQLDYYSSSFAIQFAQLVYSKLANDFDPVRCEEFRRRAQLFALDFVHYFDGQGRAIPFGRSMTYRFAMSSFWAALAFADVLPPAPLNSWGTIKGLLLRNLRFWHPYNTPSAYNTDGTLSLGFVYPNQMMLENYNSPGSVYWCCKAFICLAIPTSHPFWTSKEEAYPYALLQSESKYLHHPLHIMTHSGLDSEGRGRHTYLLSSGQSCSYPLKQSAHKYGKFAYSSAFGYSVPVGTGSGTMVVGSHGGGSLEELGGDNALALSRDGGATWVLRRDTKEAIIEFEECGWLRSMWYPWPELAVETWLIPQGKGKELWHLRVHRIINLSRNSDAQEFRTAEGGFAIYGVGRDGRAFTPSAFPLEEAVEGAWETAEGLKMGAEALIVSRAGVSGICDLSPAPAYHDTQRYAKAMKMDANTNLMTPRTFLPTLINSLTLGPSRKEGDKYLVTAVFALPSSTFGIGGDTEGGLDDPGWKEQWKTRPTIPEAIRLRYPSILHGRN